MPSIATSLPFPPSSGRLIQRLVLVTVLALAAIALTAPAEASAATYEFQPVRLHVHDTEDGWPDQYDEIRMYYGGQTFARTVRNGSTVDGSEMPRATFAGTQMQIDLRERDNGWYDNNNLGTAWATPAALDDERTVRFGGPNQWYHYELVYKVVKIAD